MEAIAIKDTYSASVAPMLLLNRGDVVHILSLELLDGEYYWFTEHQTSYGMVPTDCVVESNKHHWSVWYKNSFTEEQVVATLMMRDPHQPIEEWDVKYKHPDGAFIVGNGYRLWGQTAFNIFIKQGHYCLNYKVCRELPEGYFVETDDPPLYFDSINKLIDYYKIYRIPGVDCLLRDCEIVKPPRLNFTDNEMWASLHSRLPIQMIAIDEYDDADMDDLDIRRGDLIKVTGKEDFNWWKGTNLANGRYGLFSSYCVVKMTNVRYEYLTDNKMWASLHSRLPIQMIAIDEYDDADMDDLDIRRGDLIEVTGKRNFSWWKGKNLANGRYGLFPSNCVVKMTNVRYEYLIGTDPDTWKILEF